jgi:hypothetical protein
LDRRGLDRMVVGFTITLDVNINNIDDEYSPEKWKEK